jgi:hypothetical protein
VERRRAKCKAKHKEEVTAKCELNDRCTKRRKLKEIVVSSEEDPSPPPA